MVARLHMVRRWKADGLQPSTPFEDVELRVAVVDDTEQLAELFRSGFGSEGEDGYPSVELAYEEVRDTLTGKWGPFDARASVVALLEGRVIGASLVVADDGHDLRPLLAFLVTDPAHQGRGVGSGLVLETMRRMERQGARELHLAVEPSNPARMLYRRLGFEEEADVPR